MDGFSSLWSLTVVLGPIVLIVLIAFALIRRRRLTPAERVSQKAETERGYNEPEQMH
ncbi:hypothetical protein JYU29_08905 [Tianweitania sp. BSSL-BM11]|uniref:Cbb3-type cytochrome c oxidase subunit 3 n=1 Tax=Tianweitania aestuarii TaxID=2814886 RepID=A0ABS5RUT1_9HYPH|nr:hypothetical protein [Tianweitania aestuarii]MBS9720804.1 hypothetical protein [Tianweitania aestuarii]